MATIFQIFLAAILIWGPSSLAAAENDGTTMVKNIRFEKLDNVEKVVIELSGKAETKIFELPGEKPRVVCDLLHTGYPLKMRRVIPANGNFVKQIRVGIHNTPVAKTRIVLDIAGDAPYRLEHTYKKEDNTLVLALLRKVEAKPIDQLLADLQNGKKAEQQRQKDIESQAGEVEEPVAEPKAPAAAEDATVKPEDRQADEKVVEEVPVNGEVTGVLQPEEGTNVLRQEDSDHADDADDDIPVLFDVSFERNTNDKEMVLFRLSGFYPPVIFSTGDDDLLVVCDFLDALLDPSLEPVTETGGKYISSIGISEQESPRKVRVVLDLVDRYNYDLKQVFFREDNLFVVIISNLGEKESK